MLRPGARNEVIVRVGDVFVTKMYFTAMGDYEMHNRIVVFEADRCIAWEPGNPELARNGSHWRFDLTPDGPNATVVTETYDCPDSPESVREAVDCMPRGPTKSPHALSRGKAAVSNSATRAPWRARVSAAKLPAGPDPTISTSKRTVVTELSADERG